MKEDLKLALLVFGFILLGAGLTGEIIHFSKIIKTMKLQAELYSFERQFQKFVIGFLLDLITRPDIWLGTILLIIGYRIKIKKEKKDE